MAKDNSKPGIKVTEIKIPMEQDYLKKSVCTEVAQKYTAETGMSVMRIAQEIYAHAVMFYSSNEALKKEAEQIGGNFMSDALYKVFKIIKQKGDPIDLGGDDAFREMVYNVIWNFTKNS